MKISEIFSGSNAYSIPGNEPLLLHSKDSVTYVKEGQVDIFTVALVNGEAIGQRVFLGSFNAGEVLYYFNVLQKDSTLGVIALSSSLTKLVTVPFDKFLQNIEAKELKNSLDNWFSQALSELIHLQSAPSANVIEETGTIALEAETVIESTAKCLWLKTSGGIFLPDFLDIPVADGFIFPLVKSTWFAINKAENIAILDFELVEKRGEIRHLVHELQNFTLTCINAYREHNNRQARQTQINRRANDEREKHDSLDLLAKVYSEPFTYPQKKSRNLSLQALQKACQALGLKVRQVDEFKETAQDQIQQLGRSSNIPLRQVLLRGEWWTSKSEAMVAFLEGKNQAVALLPDKKSGYYCYDPEDDSLRKVTGEMIEKIEGTAFMPYRTLPAGKVNGKDLLKFSFFNVKSDLLRIFIFGSLGGLLGMGVPLATGLVFDQIIPSSNNEQLLQIFIALGLAAVASAVFQYIQGLSILRLESKAGHSLQSAVWDRLVNLPVNFFKDYSTGDLIQRAFGIEQIREQVSSTVITTLLSFVFSIFSFALLFYYNVTLALWACLFIAIAVFFTFITGLLSVKSSRKQQEKEGKLTSFVLQCIEGIIKIRVTASEDRAFYRWALPLAGKRNVIKKIQNLERADGVFTAIFPLFCSMLIFSLLIKNNDSIELTTGAFLGFNTAFVGVLMSFLMISASMVMIFRMIPVYQRMMPIMQQPVEKEKASVNPGKLQGAIELNNIHFRYETDGEKILKGVSFKINPGEFIALVGTSGSGKSTLFRILLGFEKAESGSINFDGKEITTLDKYELRRQIGVVLQGGSLMPGDIFTNIVGSANLTPDQALDAARMAGFEDDIKSMPMGMYTVLSEGGSGLSGGQKQRLQIARAFVHKPRILFFDEATSALDNRTQKIVTESMNKLQATRIVIAHRLSTVINADRILVLDQGQLVESGDYHTLMKKKGTFYQMANRQMV